MLLQRVLTALLLAPLVIAVIVFANALVFAIFVGISFLIGIWEWTRLAGLTRAAPRVAMLILTAALMALAWWPRDPRLWGLITVLGVVWWFIACLWLRHFVFAAAPTPENRRIKLLAGVLVIVPAWAALMLIHGVTPLGPWWTLLGLLLVWAADIGAYFSGRAFGRRKLAPQISPGKTWAGAYGGFAGAALLVALGGWAMGVHGVDLIGLVLVGVVATAAAIVGDLVESLMKRHAQMKDSGNLFPGHGGMLDRMDSVFAAVPVFALGLWLLNLLALA